MSIYTVFIELIEYRYYLLQSIQTAWNEHTGLLEYILVHTIYKTDVLKLAIVF